MKKVVVLKSAGTNNDIETARAFRLVGLEPEIVHINCFLRREKKFRDYSVLAIPGGFSYGDAISAGKVFANQLLYRLREEIFEFANSGKIIIGICNGFQVLVKAGLLPFGDGKQVTTLTDNDSGKFECRWVYLKKVKENAWTKNLPEVIQMPIAHAEGKFYAETKTIAELEKSGLVVFKYHLFNPNGSLGDIAAVTNPRGNILGIMPHPERFVSRYQHPGWTYFPRITPWGLQIFRNIANMLKK